MGMAIPPPGVMNTVAGAAGGPLAGTAATIPHADDHSHHALAGSLHAHAATLMHPPGVTAGAMSHHGCDGHGDAVKGAHGGGAKGGPIDAVGGASSVTDMTGILASLQQLLQRLTELLAAMGGGAVNQGGAVQHGASSVGGGAVSQPATGTGATVDPSNPAMNPDNQAQYALIEQQFASLRNMNF